jgi:hypothetical protein
MPARGNPFLQRTGLGLRDGEVRGLKAAIEVQLLELIAIGGERRTVVRIAGLHGDSCRADPWSHLLVPRIVTVRQHARPSVTTITAAPAPPV